MIKWLIGLYFTVVGFLLYRYVDKVFKEGIEHFIIADKYLTEKENERSR